MLDEKSYEEYKNLVKRNDVIGARKLLLDSVNTTSVVYKYRNGNNQDFDNLFDQLIWAPNPSTFNDPYDSAFLINECSKRKYRANEMWLANEERNKQMYSDALSTQKRNAYLVVCFSETNSASTMWGHYANNHKGICLGYPLRQLIEEYYCMPVIYSYDLPDGDKSSDLINLMTKSYEWKNEKEWRFIRPNIDASDGTAISFIEPQSIYIGSKAPTSVYKKVWDYWEKHSQCQVYEMKMRKTHYALEPVEIKNEGVGMGLFDVNDEKLQAMYHRAWKESKEGFVDPRKHP